MFAVREDLILVGQECPAGVDQVDARQQVLQCDFLSTQVLFHRHRVVGAALDRRLVGDDDALPPGDPADPDNDPRARRFIAVHAVRRQRGQLQKRAARVQQAVHPLARQQLAATDMAFAGTLIAPQGRSRKLGVQFGDQPAMLVGK